MYYSDKSILALTGSIVSKSDHLSCPFSTVCQAVLQPAGAASLQQNPVSQTPCLQAHTTPDQLILLRPASAFSPHQAPFDPTSVYPQHPQQSLPQAISSQLVDHDQGIWI